jgi:hypothetical protein
MAKAIPKWVQERLSKLWKKFGEKEMTYEQIEDALKPDEKSTIGVFINELRKAGWVEVKLNQEDMRRRIYILNEPNKILLEIVANGN